MKRVLAAGCVLLAASCAQLPPAAPAGAQDVPRAEIEGARGAFSAKRVAAILAGLSRNGEHDILQQHVAVEQAIVGKRLTPDVAARAGEAAVEGATPLKRNGYKVPLVRNVVREALLAMAGA